MDLPYYYDEFWLLPSESFKRLHLATYNFWNGTIHYISFQDLMTERGLLCYLKVTTASHCVGLIPIFLTPLTEIWSHFSPVQERSFRKEIPDVRSFLSVRVPMKGLQYHVIEDTIQPSDPTPFFRSSVSYVTGHPLVIPLNTWIQ